jgi:hypothetical protein
VSNLKNLLKPDGVLVVTTRSIGFPFHGWPFDFWRYEADDMRTIFSDLSIEGLEKDAEAPGIFMKARKRSPFVENDLRNHWLFSIIRLKRCKEISAYYIYVHQIGYQARHKVRRGIAFLRRRIAQLAGLQRRLSQAFSGSAK